MHIKDTPNDHELFHDVYPRFKSMAIYTLAKMQGSPFPKCQKCGTYDHLTIHHFRYQFVLGIWSFMSPNDPMDVLARIEYWTHLLKKILKIDKKICDELTILCDDCNADVEKYVKGEKTLELESYENATSFLIGESIDEIQMIPENKVNIGKNMMESLDNISNEFEIILKSLLGRQTSKQRISEEHKNKMMRFVKWLKHPFLTFPSPHVVSFSFYSDEPGKKFYFKDYFQ